MSYNKIFYLAKKSKMKRPITIGISIIICLSSVIGAFIAPVAVYALSLGGLQSTVASIIISLLLSSGTAPVNNAWLTNLNNAYGVESTFGTIQDCINSGLLTETASGLVDSGLSTAIQTLPEYTDLGISEIFTTVAGEGITAASGAVNIANTVIEVGTLGTIASFGGAVLAGVGAGVIASNVIQWAGRAIEAGVAYYQTPELLSQMGSGASYAEANYGSMYTNRYLLPDNVRAFYYPDGNNYIANIYNFNDARADGYFRSGNYKWNSNRFNVGSNANVLYAPLGSMQNFIYFENQSDFLAYINSVKNGQSELPVIKSPDIITPSGNAYPYVGQDGNDYISNIQGNVPDGYNMTPVDMDDYLNFADEANANTEDGNTGEETNGQLFNDLVNPLFVPANQQPEPEQPVNPSNPTHPAQPDQPEYPDKPDVTDADIQESLNLITTNELKEVFPFCIPWDIVDCLLLFRVANRHAPYIEFTFIDGNQITLDFSIFDSVAELLRILELIAFIVGLAISTRYLIGAS